MLCEGVKAIPIVLTGIQVETMEHNEEGAGIPLGYRLLCYVGRVFKLNYCSTISWNRISITAASARVATA